MTGDDPNGKFRLGYRNDSQAEALATHLRSLFSSLNTEMVAKKINRTGTQAKADVFDYIECFYNPARRPSTLGYLSPINFELEGGVASMNQSRCPPKR